MQPRTRQRKNASAMKLVGKLVGLFRIAANLTQAQLADGAAIQLETIASIEQGRRRLLPDLARRLDQLLDTKGALETAVDNMPEIDLIPAWAEEYMDLEREALALSWYENQVLPGLLQTENYARAVFRTDVPALSKEEIDQRVAARIQRREILCQQEPPTTSFIVSEAILLAGLGGDAVREENLRHLRNCTELPRVSVQIMPLSRHTHAGLSGPFILLETPDHQRLAYAETQRGSQLISDPDEVSILERKYGMLRTQALNTEESRDLLDRLLGRPMSTARDWFKSSYSSEQGGACLEVAYDWRKSSYSGSEGGECVEVAAHPAAIHVRDSKNPEGPTLTLAPGAWSAFAAYIGG